MKLPVAKKKVPITVIPVVEDVALLDPAMPQGSDLPGHDNLHCRLQIEDCVPNDWNPNVLSQAAKTKLRAGIKALKEQTGAIVPIIVRPHPTLKGKYQIIDGEQRWRLEKEDGVDVIDAYVLKVDNKLAQILTSSLNWLRGEANPEKYVEYLQRILVENELTPIEASELLPETSDEIEDLLEGYGLEIEEVVVPNDEVDGAESFSAREDFIEIKFVVAKDQAVVIEGEIARLGGLLKGKNIRGRALEFMAVNSSQTPLDSLEPPAVAPAKEVTEDLDEDDEDAVAADLIEEEEEVAPAPKPVKTKSKLKDRLRTHAGDDS